MLLVFVLVTVAFARADVSHLKTVQVKTPLTSYDVPLSSVDNKYFTTKYYRYGQQNLPNVSLLPPFVHNQYYQTSGNIIPLLTTNTAAGQYGLLGQYGTSGSSLQGGQGYYYGSGSSSDNQNQGIHVVNQQAYAQGAGQQGTHFSSQQGQGAGQGVLTTQFVSQPVKHEIVKTQFVSQPVHISGQQQILDNRFLSQVQGAGHVNVAHGAGAGHQQQYVKNEEHVYYFSAPEEIQHKTRLRINVVPTHTKKTNVIFVNAPSSPEVIPEVVVPPHQIVEDKIKVVVLVKEHDQFVPISVPAPLPINQGKAEVFVVKYHDKGDAERIVSGAGNVYGSTLIQQDKPSFVSALDANVKHFGVSTTAGTVFPRFSSEGGSFSTSQQGSYSGKTSTGSQSVSIQELGKSHSQVGAGLQLDGGLSSTGSYGTKSVKIVDTTPKIESYTSTYTYGSQDDSNKGLLGANIQGTAGSTKSSEYGIKSVSFTNPTQTVSSYGIQNTGQIGSGKGHYELKTASNSAQQQSSAGNLNLLGSIGSNAGGKQINTYEVKTIESVKSTPTVATFGIQNIGGNVQDGVIKSTSDSKTYEYSSVNNANQADLGVRFGNDVQGSNNRGYTIQTTDFVHNAPSSESIGHDNIDQIRKFLGNSGIEIVSISKGTLEGSAVGPNAQEDFFKSLGLNSESFNFDSAAVGQGGNAFVRTVEVNDNPNSVADLPLQSGFEGQQQIQIGNDVADVIGRSSLRS